LNEITIEPKEIAKFIINFYVGACRKAKVPIKNEYVTPHDIFSLLYLEKLGYITRIETKKLIKKMLNEH